MGSGIARLLQNKTGVRVLGAFDRDPRKIGRDLGEVIGGAPAGVQITAPPGESDPWPQAADVVIIATSSFVREVAGAITAAARAGINVICIAEEMAFPWINEPALAANIDQVARAQGVTVVGTGINPGFVLDTLILTLTAPCLEVRRIGATRVNDLSPFGPTVMRTQGVGLSVREFEQGLIDGEVVGHVGFPQSIQMVAKTLGWELEKIDETREPIISKVRRETEYVQVEPGQVAGCRHSATGYVRGEPRIKLVHPQQVLPHLEGVDTGDFIEIDGQPDIRMHIKPEIPGGIGTVAMAVNVIPQVLTAKSGLLSMAELTVPAALLGDVREIVNWRRGLHAAIAVPSDDENVSF